MMSDLERTMEEEREALRREAAAMAASAAAAGEDRARSALSARYWIDALLFLFSAHLPCLHVAW